MNGKLADVSAPPSVSNSVPTLASDNDSLRVVLNAIVIIGAITASLIALAIILNASAIQDVNKKISPSDVVAILASVTTFLGTAVGVFFGVTVGQSGQRTAQNAAASAAVAAASSHASSQAAQSAASKADAARDAAAMAQDGVDETRAVIRTKIAPALDLLAQGTDVDDALKRELRSFVAQ